MKLITKLLATAALMSGTAGVFAYPDRPIQLIIPFAAGGPTDTVGRALAQSMGTDLKQPLVAVNVGGAGGTTGSARVAQANPDGYTLLLMHIGMSTAPSLYKKMSFDPLKDFEYIGLVVDVPMTLLGKKDLLANNFAELQTYIKQNAAKLNYAHAGIGSASHLCGMLFMSAIQTDLTTVPYQGTGPAMTA
ncbi:MAG: tripartite tricarboxylate transporter substrate-binding protein, partial [Burkholderiales bacterium]